MPTHTTELTAEPRTVIGKHVKKLRRAGIVPANIFGHGDSVAIQAPARTLEHLLAHGGRTGIVSISLGSGEPRTALLKRISRDPRTAELVHLDFQAVSLTQSVTTTVPLRFVGEAPAVTQFDAILSHPLTELRIEAQASNLPDVIEVDLSPLAELHSILHVRDVQAPAGVTILDGPEEAVVVVQPPRVEREEAEEAAAEAAAAPEAPAAEPASEEEEEEAG